MAGRRDELRTAVAFVRAVRARPCLWDSACQSYTKKELTCRAWKEIASELKDSEHNCRERWKNIRTAFVRSLKPAKPGRPAKGAYYLAAQLAFLLPHVKSKLTDGADEDGESSQGPACEVQVLEPPPVLKIERIETMEEAEAEAAPLRDWTGPSPRAAVTRTDHDADEYFLFSILPDMRKLSSPRKRRFKVETMSILNKLLDQDEGSRPFAPFGN